MTTQKSGISTKVSAKFDDFLTFGDPTLERMKQEAVSFVTDLFCGCEPRWLSLLGKPGTGKTMLASRISRLFRNYRHGRIDWPRSEATRTSARPYGSIVRWHGGFINWGNAINQRMLQGDYGFLEDMRDYDFFAIDDIVQGTEKLRALWASKLYDVFEARQRKWTVITANYSLKQIAASLDTRLASRMIRHGGIVVDVDTTDFNLRKR